MRKVIFALLICMVAMPSFAQENQEKKTNEEVKTGWTVGVLPALGYDSNLGFLYGAIVNSFDFGDGSRYPDFNHNLYLQLSAYTKGSMDAIAYFDSYTLIPNKHFIGRLTLTGTGHTHSTVLTAHKPFTTPILKISMPPTILFLKYFTNTTVSLQKPISYLKTE